LGLLKDHQGYQQVAVGELDLVKLVLPSQVSLKLFLEAMRAELPVILLSLMLELFQLHHRRLNRLLRQRYLQKVPLQLSIFYVLLCLVQGLS